MRNFKKLCTASDLAAVDAPGVIMGIREAIASFMENFIISAWAILLFVQQYRHFSRPQSVDRTTDGSRFFCLYQHNSV